MQDLIIISFPYFHICTLSTYQIYNLQNVLSFECHNLQDTKATKYLQEMYTKYNLRKELAISNEQLMVVYIDSLQKPIGNRQWTKKIRC